MKPSKSKLAIALFSAAAFLGAQAATAAPTPKQRYVVIFKPGSSKNGEKALIAEGGKIKLRLGKYNAVAVEMSAGKAASFATNPNVESIEIDAIRAPIGQFRDAASGADRVVLDADGESTQTVPYGIDMVQATGYAGNPNAGIKVCVIDSGYDAAHEDLAPSAADGGPVTGSDDLSGAGPWDHDGDGHGTHVAGTISASDNGLGVIGVFPDVPMHIVRVFGDDGIWAYSSELVDALDQCVGAGAKVVNMSLGGPAPSKLENKAFLKAQNDNGVLSIAAAGNGGFGRAADCEDYAPHPWTPPREACKMHYPAAYTSVMAVAAVDSNAAVASFSQRNTKVEIAAPGVSVLSTVPMGYGLDATLSIDGQASDATVVPMTYSALTPVAGPLQDCGLGVSAADCGDATGKVCLISRGSVSFRQKAESCQAAGGIGAIVYNNVPGGFGGTLGVNPVTTIPVVSTDQASGQALAANDLGKEAALDFVQSNYDEYSGTSMATPHVAGVAALVWSTHPQCSGTQIRNALNATAVDLGKPGADSDTGNGLIQAQAASDYLDQWGCAGK